MLSKEEGKDLFHDVFVYLFTLVCLLLNDGHDSKLMPTTQHTDLNRDIRAINNYHLAQRYSLLRAVQLHVLDSAVLSSCLCCICIVADCLVL